MRLIASFARVWRPPMRVLAILLLLALPAAAQEDFAETLKNMDKTTAERTIREALTADSAETRRDALLYIFTSKRPISILWENEETFLTGQLVGKDIDTATGAFSATLNNGPIESDVTGTLSGNVLILSGYSGICNMKLTVSASEPPTGITICRHAKLANYKTSFVY